MTVKIKLRGHESFNLREGWIRKGLAAIEEKNVDLENNNAKDVFLLDNSTEILGVGANMVKSIRYWLQACGLTTDIRLGSRRITKLSEGFGDIINEKDKYIEDIFTSYLLHYKLVTNKELATAWYIFFNDFNVSEFSRNDLYDGLEISLNRLNPDFNISERLLSDDCSCLIKTYYTNNEDFKNPEDSLNCPFSELNLLDKKITLDKKEIFIKKKPKMHFLDPMIVFYVIVDRLGKEKNTTVDRLLNEECNIGRVFNLDRITINQYLDILQDRDYLQINRTAGLDTVYLTREISCQEILSEHYNNIERED